MDIIAILVMNIMPTQPFRLKTRNGIMRFKEGDRVSCKMNKGGLWMPGTVIMINYRQEDWSPERVAPYQIELDAGVKIYAPTDTNDILVPEGDMEGEVPEDVQAALAALRMPKSAEWFKVESSTYPGHFYYRSKLRRL